MASQNSQMSPTAANIISSLGIKGATVNENLPGYVPVLDANGKLNAKFIPADAAQLSIPPLSNLAFVDPYTSVAEYAADGVTRLRVGSVVAPFKSISEAAENFSPTSDAAAGKYVAFALVPGKYEDDVIQFPVGKSPLSLYFIGLGECRFSQSKLTIYGMSGTISGRKPVVFLQNVYMAGEIAMSTDSDAVVLGKSYIHVLSIGSGNTLSLASESRVDSTDAGTVSFLSEASRIKNTSDVHGVTVGDALGRLGRRKVRISNVTADSSGFDINSSSSYIDLSAESSGSSDIYDLRRRDRLFVEGINRLFKRGKDIVADSVTAKTVIADVVNTKELRMDALALGGYKLTIDTYGYLVVADGSQPLPPPPDSVVLIRDTGSSGEGAIYLLGVANGRLFIDPYDDGSSSPVENVLNVYDPDTGYEYAVSVDNGRVVIDRIET